MPADDAAESARLWTLQSLDEKLQDCRSDESITLSGAKVGSRPLAQLLSCLGLNEAVLQKAEIAKTENSRSVRGTTSLFDQVVTVAIEFEITKGNLSIALTAALPSEVALTVPGLQWGIRNVNLVLSVNGPALIVPLVSIVLIADIQKSGKSILDQNNEPARVMLIPGSARGGWRLEAVHIPLPQLHEIAELVGIQDLPIPPALDKVGGLSIRSLELEFTPGNPTPDSIAIALATTESWPIVTNLDLFTINDVTFLLGVEFRPQPDDKLIEGAWVLPENNDTPSLLPRLSVTVIGTVTVKLQSGKLDLPVKIAYDAGEWRMGIFGAHGFPSFGELVAQVAGSDSAAILPDGLKALRIEDASVEVTLGSGSPTLRSLYFAVELSDWPITKKDDVALVELKRTALEFTVDRAGGGTSGFVTGTMCLGDDLEITVTAEKLNSDSGNEWQFTGATGPGQEISIGKLIKGFDKNAEPPPVLSTFSIENLGVSFNTATKNFSFACEGKIRLGDGGPILACKGDIKVTNGEPTFGGTLTVGVAEFQFNVRLAKDVDFEATWKQEVSKPALNLKSISDKLPDLPGLENLLIPNSATLKLNVGEQTKTLALGCDISGTKAAFLFRQDSSTAPPSSIVAFGLKPGKISTENLGPLGPALRPNNIALDNLVIVTATADAPKDFQLTVDGTGVPFTRGLFLKGELKFEQTSFSYPFECNLGGQKPQNKLEARAAGGGAAKPAADHKTPEVEEGDNNVKVGRTIGPVTFRKMRFESRDDESGKKCVYVLLDASLGSGGFDLDLDGFNINFPLDLPLQLAKDPKDLSKLSEIGIGLDGLSIAYSNLPLTVSGGFARAPAKEPYVDYLYEGHLLIKAEAFQIAVLGSYGTILIDQKRQPSLFVYGMYDGVIGGPAAFYVTGLALGGGYNARLALPPVEEVATFPLVQAVTDPTKFQSEALRQIVLPSYGDYWLALGIKFTSFKMADSFALFSVAFGNRLQFALLGLTKFTVPTGAEEGKCAVYAELQIRAVLDPDAGVFSIEGRLTNNSYVFTKEIHLTGGFAFFVWFGNAAQAGDFVISLGGYHPDFLPPPHYPAVPRIGIRGQLSDALTVAGEAYFALTPSCLMAGLKLAAVFESGNITAAFVAYTDFLVAWAPFHYDARIGMGIAVTIRLARSFKLEISADLHVWGPPFAGTAHVSFWIASFTVKFGDTSGTKPDPLEWDPFQNAFLPKADPKAEHALLSTIRITEGLVREVKRENEAVTYRIVNAHELIIETDSAVPCSEVQVGKSTKTATADIGIRPMAATKLNSLHTVSIKTDAGTAVEEKFKAVQWSEKNFPKALWSPKSAQDKPEAENMITKVPSGVVLRVQPTVPKHCLGPFPIEIFKWDHIPKNIPWATAEPAPNAATDDFANVSKDNPLRDQIRECLAKRLSKRGTSWNEIKLSNTAGNPLEFFQALPTCATLGQGF